MVVGRKQRREREKRMGLGMDPAGWSLLILIGCFSGFASGLLRIGEGFIVVPSLMIALPYLGVGGPEMSKIAAATSLGLLIPTSITSTEARGAETSVDWDVWSLLLPSAVAGAILATTFASQIDGRLITLFFVGAALVFAIGLFRNREGGAEKDGMSDEPPLVATTVKTIAAGSVAALLGLGASFFCAPTLTRFLPMMRAGGTAAALSLPLALAGIGGYLLAKTPDICSQNCTGYVFLPAVAAIGMTSVLTAPIGAKLTHFFPLHALRIGFAILLIGVTLQIASANLSLGGLVSEAKNFATEMLIKPLCDPKPSPAAPIFETPPTHTDQAARSLGARHGPALTGNRSSMLLRAAIDSVRDRRRSAGAIAFSPPPPVRKPAPKERAKKTNEKIAAGDQIIHRAIPIGSGPRL
jgi:uncharacterized protein